MNKTFLKIASRMLELAAGQICFQSDEFILENTPENFAFIQEVVKASHYPDEEIFISQHGIEIVYSLIMDYCSEVLKKESDAMGMR